MCRADPAKGYVQKCDRSKVAGCLGCELGLKELKPRQLKAFMNGCFDNQLPAVVFDGVKTSRMLSCQAVTIGRDVRGVASLAWGGVRGTGGDWSVIDHAAQPLPRHPSRVHRQCIVELYSVNCGLLSCFLNFLN